MSNFPNIVSTKWLAENLKLPELRILDASWHMPSENRNARYEFESVHIPGAQFFDIDEISDNFSELPHMAPDLEKFTSKTRKLGISDGTKVVIYDSHGIFSAPRVWWLFKLFQKKNVAVLDGGLPKWQQKGFQTTSVIRAPKDRHLTLSKRDHWVKNVSEVAQASKLKSATILDARAPERFAGEIDEPRPGLRSGHIPNAKNLYFKNLLTPEGCYKPINELQKIFDHYDIQKESPIITSCGSGVTASIITLALELCGYNNHSLYDGSWVEWGSNDLLKIQTGSE